MRHHMHAAAPMTWALCFTTESPPLQVPSQLVWAGPGSYPVVPRTAPRRGGPEHPPPLQSQSSDHCACLSARARAPRSVVSWVGVEFGLPGTVSTHLQLWLCLAFLCV